VSTTNSIAGIVYEIKRAKEPISLQSISTVPLEKESGTMRLHAGVDQTSGELVKTMDIDQAMKLVYVHEQIKSRRLTHPETIVLNNLIFKSSLVLPDVL
jgi:hypothetical protein